MKKTTKILTFLMAALLIFTLAACGNTEKSSAEAGDTQSTEEKTSLSGVGEADASDSDATAETGEPTEAGEAAGTGEPTEAGEATGTGAATEQEEVTERTEATESTEPAEAGKVLVVYFSWSTSGNTERMATYIQGQTGADILKLEPANPYPTDYSETGDIAEAERDENARPEISNLPESISEYDTIFVGYPIWWHTAPMIIGTFLENYDLTGVEIYPFSQSASMDTEQFDNSMDFVRENAEGANVHDGLFVEPDDTDGMIDYLEDNGFAK